MPEFCPRCYKLGTITNMATLQLKLPDHLKAAAETQAAAAGCRSVDDYIASLIEADELPSISGELEAQLLAGIDSGPAIDITRELLAEVKRRSAPDLTPSVNFPIWANLNSRLEFFPWQRPISRRL